MKRLLSALPFAALWLLLLAPATDAAPACRDNPLAVYGDQAGRYKIVDPCVTISGQIIMLADESAEQGGERHVYLWASIGNADNWADAEFVETALLPPVVDLLRLRTATITGALVYDTSSRRYTLRPSWWLHEVNRAYPERRPDDSVWRVWQWRDGSYSQERVPE